MLLVPHFHSTHTLDSLTFLFLVFVSNKIIASWDVQKRNGKNNYIEFDKTLSSSVSIPIRIANWKQHARRKTMNVSNNNGSQFIYGVSVGVLLTLAISRFSKQKSIIQGSDEEALTDGDQDFINTGNFVLRWIANYRTKTANTCSVISRVAPNYLVKALPCVPPKSQESWSDIFSDIDKLIVPGLTHWESTSKFFAYFKTHSSYPAVLADLLCAGLNVIGFDWIASPAATELEVVVLDWLAKFLNLPTKYLNLAEGSGIYTIYHLDDILTLFVVQGGSVIQGSSGEAAIVAFLAAITRKKAEYKRNNKEPPMRENMVVIGSDQNHAIVKKACMVLGIGHYHQIPARKENDFAVDAKDIGMAVEEQINKGYVPIVLVATTGTTSSCACDPLQEMGQIASQYDMWFHIDAAYGGVFACLPEMRHFFNGIESFDSFAVNCHKKLLCPFDITAMYVLDRKPILDALSLQPEYLRNAASESGAVVDYQHWQMPLGRRFRSLKLWFVFRRYGSDGLMRHLRQTIELSEYFASLMLQHGAFELVVPVRFGLVCFRLKNKNEDQHKIFLDAVKHTGDCFIIHTKLNNEMVLRFACGGLEQSKEDIAGGWVVISRVYNEMKF